METGVQAYQDFLDDVIMTGFGVERLRELFHAQQRIDQGVIRISALPSAFACPSSMLPTKHPYNPRSDMADLGTAAHDALATVVPGGIPDIEVIAKKHNVDPDELAPLVAIGTGAWRELGFDSQHARTEYRLQGRGIAGTTDVVYHDGVRAAVIDWKTNRVKRTYRAQLLGYAAALTDEFVAPESGEVTITTVWLRFGEFETATVTLDDIQRFYHDLEARKLETGQVYAPGHACTYCPRQMVCEARHEYLRAACTALMAVQHVDMRPAALSSLYHQAKQLRKALDQYDSALRMELQRSPLPDGDGNMLELGYLERDRIDPVKAWPIVEDFGVDDEDIAHSITMSKTKLMRFVGKDAKRGEKGKMRGAFWHAMQEAGAVKKHVSETITIRKQEESNVDDA